MKKPWYFEVNEYGTIVEADDTGPEVNSDVYEDIDVKGLLTPEDIIKGDQHVRRRTESCTIYLAEIHRFLTTAAS